MELLIYLSTWAQFDGDTGDVSSPLFQTGGYNMICPPYFLLFRFCRLFGEASKTKVMFVTFCVKSFSC